MLVELEDRGRLGRWYWNKYGQEGNGLEEQEVAQQHRPRLLQQAPRDQGPTAPCPALAGGRSFKSSTPTYVAKLCWNKAAVQSTF